MNDFTLTGYGKNGVTTWKLNGQGAVLEGQIVTVQHPDAIGFQPGRTAYVTASIAQINQENRHIRMEHDVTMHTSDGMWLASPIMYWMPDQNQVATDQAVRIESDHMLLHGRGLNALTQLKEATLLRDIEMVLNPSDHEKALPGLSAVGARGETRKQVTITCDGPLAFDYEHNIATFEHNVHVNDPSGDLYSDKLIAYINQDTHTIRYAEAIGRVRILQPNRNTATSERAVYEPAIGKITLVGKPGLVLYPKNDQAGPQSSFGGFLEVPMSVGSAPEEPPQKQLELGGETTLQVGKTVPEEAAAAEADDTQEEAEPEESGSHHGTSVY